MSAAQLSEIFLMLKIVSGDFWHKWFLDLSTSYKDARVC